MAPKKTSAVDNGTNYSFPYMREVNTRTNWENMKLSCWDPNKKTVLGRDLKGWGKIIHYLNRLFCALKTNFYIGKKQHFKKQYIL